MEGTVRAEAGAFAFGVTVVSTDGAVCATEEKPSVLQWVVRRCLGGRLAWLRPSETPRRRGWRPQLAFLGRSGSRFLSGTMTPLETDGVKQLTSRFR